MCFFWGGGGTQGLMKKGQCVFPIELVADTRVFWTPLKRVSTSIQRHLDVEYHQLAFCRQVNFHCECGVKTWRNMSSATTEAEAKPQEPGENDEGVDFLYRAMCKIIERV